jgi:hypothetical protein
MNLTFALDAAGRALGGVPAVDEAVHAIAVRGRSVFIGGTFTRVGGRAREGLAALPRPPRALTGGELATPAPAHPSPYQLGSG